MMNKQSLFLAGLGVAGVAAAAFLAGSAGSTMSARTSQGQQQSAAAMVESEEYVGLTGEAPHLSARYTFAVRGDGASATVTRKFDRVGNQVASDRDLRLPHGVRVEVSDHLEAVTATRVPGMPAPPRSQSDIWKPETNCETAADGMNRRSKSEAGESILGFATRKIVEDNPTMRLTRWFAPALGCAELKQLAEFKAADGSITDISERRAVSARAGEPDSALFAWPSDYTNLSPSERYLRDVAHCGCAMNSNTLAALRKEDPWFQQNRLDRPE